MKPEVIARNRDHLAARIEVASEKYSDALVDWPLLRERVLNEYPSFNSHSLVEIECSVCHQVYEVELHNLYNGHFICKPCQFSTKAQPAASVPEVRRQVALTQLSNGDLQSFIDAAHSSEVRRKAWESRKKKLYV